MPPKGAPNVLLIMTDDQGYGVTRHLRRRHPDAGDGSAGEGGTALHAVPLHRALLADAGGADHRPQPPLGGLRRDRGNVHRLPGLRQRHPQGQGDHRHDSPGQRLRDVVVRQEPQHADLSIQPGRAVRSMAQRDGLRVFLRVHGRRDQPVDALSLPRSHADLSVGRASRTTT